MAKSYQDCFLIYKTEITVLVHEVYAMKEVKSLVFGQVPYEALRGVAYSDPEVRVCSEEGVRAEGGWRPRPRQGY